MAELLLARMRFPMPRRTDLDIRTATGGAAVNATRVVRILLVDDDPQASALIELALAEAPFRWMLETVPTATAGLRRIIADDHDVYLIDQQLPDRNGISLIAEMKSQGTEKPFILMTGHGSGSLDEAALHEGAADYVEKHMAGTHLARSIRYALRDFEGSRLLREREEQLRQAQKMEALGRLAGGVAHDFNNLLTAIVGYADLITERLDPTEQTAREMNEIRKAADSAAALTRQLLSFSRKQFLNPTILDLNETASGPLQMLPRLIGEHIQTSVSLARNLPRVKADASQMEQILVNLVLNARDAMPLGGDLTIETANVTMDQERLARENLTLPAGPYVMLAVKDTGSGMDAETRVHAFEPFFTTKPKGKGTGLGLATVYGIVDQSGGGVSITSAPGRGTNVRIYLPPAPVTDSPARTEVITIADTGGSELVLLVEDNDSVRDLAVNALRRRGYTVIEKRNAEEAIEWSISSNVKPHLLVTDVVMPGLSGPNLAARLLQQNPHLRLLFMSGYTDDLTGNPGSSWGVPMLQKPFTPAKLAEYVRHALDSKTRA
jgi:two-component system cell cycle sensor histidine kinase/response regulator CckA